MIISTVIFTTNEKLLQKYYKLVALLDILLRVNSYCYKVFPNARKSLLFTRQVFLF